ncbi:MAG: hypothetical protein IT443_13740 [Phycisphaeraceae bacterium]|nr:hypothetical protein [Phycisphaeraceae bacterium]
MSDRRLTIAHVTHEAVDHLGGIGTVLEGLITSPVYQQQVRRSILVGPTNARWGSDPELRLGSEGRVLYSSADSIDRGGLAYRFRPIEWAFGIDVVYGTRQFHSRHEGRSGEAEVLLIDVMRMSPPRLAVFKHRLWQAFGIDSTRYEGSWDYEEYMRLAEPAFYALLALLADHEKPCVLISHEFMGMPTALQATLEGREHFRTVFHAHECATARRLVEDHAGHDVMFYNVLRQAAAQDLYVEDVFGTLDSIPRHALVNKAYLCDGIIAVGDKTRDEMAFLSRDFHNKPIDLVYNGVPAMKVDLQEKLRSRRMLLEYSKALLGHEPDVLMTHVTRPVISKGLWRDLKVCHNLDGLLGKDGKTAVLYILTSGGGVRRMEEVMEMERSYGWPRNHRYGFPDLVGPEVDLFRDVDAFNKHHHQVQVVLVNQFGWSRERIGRHLPEAMTVADLRRATDVEFGMAVYEPFGISPLEPLGSGAVCVITNVCGCEGFVNHVAGPKGTPNVLSADFTQLSKPRTIDQLKAMTRTERDALETEVATDLAKRLMAAIPRDDKNRETLLNAGQALVARMGWDQVIEEGFVPLLQRVIQPGQGEK